MTMPGTGSCARAIGYLDHLARESARFALVLDGTAQQARVPSCPEWTADDLLWHLAKVQWFWGSIVRDRITTFDVAKELELQRPAWPSLRELYARASTDLGELLASSPPETRVWTWADEDQTVGFVRRRQAQEALIHRVDAELTAGSRTSMDAALSADGVDEMLRLMYGGDQPAWGAFTPDSGQTLRIDAIDTGDSWQVSLGRFTGTDPGDQEPRDQPAIDVTVAGQGMNAAATISGAAADLDCWLWHRPSLAPLDRSGDEAVISGFEAIIAEGVS